MMSGGSSCPSDPIDFDGLTLAGVGPLAFWAYVFLAAVSPDAGSRLVRAIGRNEPCRPERTVKSTLRRPSEGRLESLGGIGFLPPHDPLRACPPPRGAEPA